MCSDLQRVEKKAGTERDGLHQEEKGYDSGGYNQGGLFPFSLKQLVLTGAQCNHYSNSY